MNHLIALFALGVFVATASAQPAPAAPATAAPAIAPVASVATTPASIGVCTLSVVSTPDSAQVCLGDTVLGYTPCVVTHAPGDLKLVLKKKGYFVKSAVITGLTAGENRSMSLELSIPATLVILTTPPGATITFCGRPMGPSPVTIDKLKPGPVDVLAELAGHLPDRKPIIMTSGATDTMRLTLPLKVEPVVASVDSNEIATDETAKPVATAPATTLSSALVDKICLGVFAVFCIAILGVELASYR